MKISVISQMWLIFAQLITRNRSAGFTKTQPTQGERGARMLTRYFEILLIFHSVLSLLQLIPRDQTRRIFERVSNRRAAFVFGHIEFIEYLPNHWYFNENYVLKISTIFTNLQSLSNQSGRKNTEISNIYNFDF